MTTETHRTRKCSRADERSQSRYPAARKRFQKLHSPQSEIVTEFPQNYYSNVDNIQPLFRNAK